MARRPQTASIYETGAQEVPASLLRQSVVQASPDAFGYQVAAAGAGLAEQAADGAYRYQRTEDALALTKAQTQSVSRLAQLETDFQNEQPKISKDGVSAFEGEIVPFYSSFKKRHQERAKEAEEEIAGQLPAHLQAQYRQKHTVLALASESKVANLARARQGEHARATLLNEVEAKSRIYAASENLTQQTTIQNEFVDNVTRWVQAGIIGADDGQRLTRGFLEKAQTGAAGNAIVKNPEAAIEMLTGGAWPEIEPNARRVLMDRAERVIEHKTHTNQIAVAAQWDEWADRQDTSPKDAQASLDGMREAGQISEPQWSARTIKLRSRDESKAREGLANDVRDHLASLETTGQGVANVPERAMRGLNDAEKKDFLDSERLARDVHATSQTLTFATPAETAAVLEGLRPKPGAEGFASKQHAYESLSRRAAQIQKARADDIAGYALGKPEVRAAFEAAQKDPNQSQAYAQATLKAQAGMGVPEAERRILPEAAARNIVTELSSPMGAERAADTIEGLSRSYGPHFGQVYRDLVKEKLSPEFITLAMLDGPRDAVVRKQLGEAVKVGRKTLADNLNPPDKKAIDETIQSEMQRWAKVELSRSGTDGNVQAVRNAAELLAYQNAARGQSPSDAAKAAVSAIVSDRYDILDGPNFAMYAPKGAGDLVESWGQKTLAELKADDLRVPQARPGETLTDVQRQAAYLKAVKRGRWVLDETGDGAVLVDQVGQPVFSNAGLIRFKFRDMRAEVMPTGTQFGVSP